MNREVIKRYKKEFEWWLNGDHIRAKHGDKWCVISEPDFHAERCYVIDDEYLALRIAQAEGKTIQVDISEWKEYNRWVDCHACFFDNDVKSYRVKPETVTKWQWIYINVCSTFSMTTSHYSSKEDMNDSLKSKAIEPCLPSVREE